MKKKLDEAILKQQNYTVIGKKPEHAYLKRNKSI